MKNRTSFPKIRPGTIVDAAQLSEFGTRTFVETFGSSNTLEDMEAYLSANYSPEIQSAELTDPNLTTLVAEWENRIVAFSQIRLNLISGFYLGDNPIELWRFYLDSHWHGSGFAYVLMDSTLEAAKQYSGTSIWLSVWEENHQAISFYKKCGFKDAGKKDFWLGNDKQTDRLLVASLNPQNG
jgi:ribosomal protein S18 acetylase RimI-like enzyme